MTLLVATPTAVYMDAVSHVNGIKMFTPKLKVWDEESIIGTCGNTANAINLAQALTDFDEVKRNPANITKHDTNSLGVFTAENDLYYFAAEGAYRVIDPMIMGSLKAPFTRLLRRKGLNLHALLDNHEIMVQTIRELAILENPNLYQHCSNCHDVFWYGSWALKKDQWAINEDWNRPGMDD